VPERDGERPVENKIQPTKLENGVSGA